MNFSPNSHRAIHTNITTLLIVTAISVGLFTSGCGSATSSTTTGTTTTTTTNVYATAYKSISWGATATVTYPTSCTMTITVTGKPNYTPNAYYLGPANTGDTIVAYTALTKTALAVISYATNVAPNLKGSSATINICPTKATSTTATSGGAIGYLISGTAMFDPFEMDASTAAVNDNASYTFTDGSGVSQTAYFLDQCDSHSNGTTWHAHGNPNCVTSQVDTGTGPSHIIGIALDGFPIYGGRDISGNVITVSQLDACNGITSATPEFPSGAYHYVLPIGVTTQYASLNCYAGTATKTALAEAAKLACNMKMMLAMQKQQNTHPYKKEDPSRMATMVMPDGTRMPAGSM
jgi:hypothetical protein